MLWMREGTKEKRCAAGITVTFALLLPLQSIWVTRIMIAQIGTWPGW